MSDLGDNLSSYRNIEFLSASSPEELKSQLGQIKLPYKLIAIYAQGGAHIAWIVPTQPIIKVSKSTKTKGVK